MGYAETMAEIQKARAAAAQKRVERDEKELDEIAPLLLEDKHVLVRLPDAAPELPGHYIGFRPSGPLVQRFKMIMWKDSAQRGVVEAKANAGADLARQCLVYPSAERYAELVAAHPMVPDKVAKALIDAAEAGAEAEGKG